MTIARRLFVVPVILLALTSPVAADDAWVLWTYTTGLVVNGRSHEQWDRVDAYETKQECRDALEEKLSSFKEHSIFKVSGDTVTTVGQNDRKPPMRSTYSCLPSGTDPRPRLMR
jgi:hypothetical protein